MKIISSRVHGYLDYLVVIFLLVSPSIFHMDGNLAIFTYVLAAVHFILTMLTAFELGLVKLIPFRIHGFIEFVVSIALAGVAVYFLKHGSDLGWYFYLALAVLIMIVFLLTDFKSGVAGRM